MRQLRWLVLLLVFALSGLAAAQSVPTECSAAAPTAGALTLTAFLPNAPCLMAQNTMLWGQWGLWKGIAIIGAALCAGLFIWKAVMLTLGGTPEKLAMPLLVSAAMFALISPAIKGEGLIPEIQAQGMTGLNSLYVASASVGNRALSEGPTSVKAKTAKLGQNIALLVARASYAESIRAQLRAIAAGQAPGNISDPNLASQLYAQQVSSDQAAAGSLMDPNSAVFNIGFLVLYGLFAIFAGIIATIGIGIQLALLLLPVALAFVGTGQYAPLRAIGGTYIAGLLTVAVLPLMVATVSVIGLSIPADRLTPTVTTMNSELGASLQRYQQSIQQGCSFTDVACTLDQQVIQPMQADLASFKELFTQVMLGVAAMLVGLSIAANVLRRPPAFISSMFGSSGGGESSGVHTGALSQTLGMLAGGKMMQNMMRQSLNGGGKTGKKSSSGNSSENAGSEGGASGAEGSGSNPPPSPAPDVDVKGGGPGGAAASDPNVPPASASGSGSFATSYAAARERGAGPAAAAAAGGLGATVQGGTSHAQMLGSEYGAQLKAAGQRMAWGNKENADRAGAAYRGAAQSVRQVSADVQANREARQAAVPPPANPDANELYGKGGGRPSTNARIVTPAQVSSGSASAPTRAVAVARADRAAAVQAAPRPVPAPAPVPVAAPAPAAPTYPRGTAVAATRNVQGVYSSANMPTPVAAPAPAPATPAPAPVAAPQNRNEVARARMATPRPAPERPDLTKGETS